MATTTLSNDNTIQFTAAQTSREVKKHLKKVFPHMEKLSVTCKNFSLRISWINGPSRNAVEQATKVFEGATLEQNGGDTIKGYKPPVEFQGKQIDFGIDYIFCERTLSPENEAIITKYVQDKYGEDTSVNHHISEKRIWDLIKETDANDFSSLVWAPIETTVEEPITEEIATVASTLSLPVDEVAKVYAIAQEYKQLQDADRATFAAESALETVQAQEEPYTLTCSVCEYQETRDKNKTYSGIPRHCSKVMKVDFSEWESTPKQPKTFIIREEAHPLKAKSTIYRAYHQNEDGTVGQPCYIGAESIEEVERRLIASEKVATVAIMPLQCQEEVQHMEQQTPQAYRHTFDGVHIFYYHHSCVGHRLPTEVTFEPIALKDVPLEVDCEYCYEPMHIQQRQEEVQHMQGPKYKDPYLREIEENKNNPLPEQEKRLMLFIAWLNVRKDVELPDDPKKLVKEFLALERE